MNTDLKMRREEPDQDSESTSMNAEMADSRSRGLMFFFFREVKANRLALTGFFILTVIVLMTLIGPFFAYQGPLEQNLGDRLQSPSTQYWFGTDEMGRDVYSRLVSGGRISLFIGIMGTLGGLIGGITIGLVAGYFGGTLDMVLMRAVDVMYAFPGVLLAILIVSILGASLANLIVAIAIWGIPTCSRVVRGTVLSLKEQDYIHAARAVGASSKRIMVHHLLANTAGPIIVYATLTVAGSILTGAALGFLGLGVQPPTPEWGTMLSTARRFILPAPHLTLFPGIAIFLTVLSINFVGDALRDAVDPHSQTRTIQ